MLILLRKYLSNATFGTKIYLFSINKLKKMINPSKRPSVTAVDYGGVITAFFTDLPGLVVQGNSADDVHHKLASLLDSYIKRLNNLKNNIDIKPEYVS
jgi:hypothetical protein